MITELYYRVNTFREAGLEARWSKTGKGQPCIVAKRAGGHWYMITNIMFERMKKVGIAEAFEEHTLLGDVLSIPR